MNEKDVFLPDKKFWQDPNEPYSHYYRWVWEYLAYLSLLCRLKRESNVLELGCSHGRTSQALLEYLWYPAFYRGLDVDKSQIEQATKLISSVAANFQYIHADVYNRHYNPKGRYSASEYVFPFEDNTFDCVYAASVFTHLLPNEVENYFRQTSRVLVPRGKALFSFFIFDRYQGPGTSQSPLYEFEHPLENIDGVKAQHQDYPDNVIAYSEDRIKKYAEANGLTVSRIVNGLWSRNPGHALHEQDLVLLERLE